MQYKTGLTSAAILASTAFAACMYIMWFVSYISKIYLFQISETRRTIWLFCSGIEKKKTKFHSFRTFRHRWNSIRYRFNAFVLFTIFIIFLLFQASDHFHACFANWLLFFSFFPFLFSSSVPCLTLGCSKILSLPHPRITSFFCQKIYETYNTVVPVLLTYSFFFLNSQLYCWRSILLFHQGWCHCQCSSWLGQIFRL